MIVSSNSGMGLKGRVIMTRGKGEPKYRLSLLLHLSGESEKLAVWYRYWHVVPVVV